MNGTLNLVIGLAMGLNLLALGSSRLPSLIRAMSLQGMVLGVMPLLMEYERFDWRVLLVAFATMAGKGVVIPGLLRRAMRAANIEREVEPFIGFVPSLLLGAGGTIVRWRWRGPCRCCRNTRGCSSFRDQLPRS